VDKEKGQLLLKVKTAQTAKQQVLVKETRRITDLSLALTQLQKAYEVILGSRLDKRNFRKRISLLDIVKPLNKKQKSVGHRPAQLYKFKSKKLEFF
jgi:hypothetical protein